jgi:hypothetical protein
LFFASVKSPKVSAAHKRRMQESSPLSTKIFFVCLFFFLLLYAYAIYFAELRMQFEGAEDSILTCLGRFRIPFYRYAYILNKILFLLSLKIHLPFKAVTALYSFGDGLYYLAVALGIIWFTRRYDYAALVLAAPLLMHDSVFYFIANEIFLSGAIMVMFIAVHQYMREGRLKRLVLALCIFFVIWGHPVTMFMLAIFLPFIYYSVDRIKKDWKLIAFIAVNVLLRLALFSNYDQTKVGSMTGPWFEPHFWWSVVLDYFDEFPYLVVLDIFMVIAVVQSKERLKYIGIIMLPALIACCNASNSPVGMQYFTKFLYPAQLFIALQAVIYLGELSSRYSRLAPLFVAILLYLGGQRLLERNHTAIYQRAVITQRLNTLCAKEDSTHSKWYVRQSTLNLPTLFYSDECHESLFYSEYQNLSPSIQLAQVKPEEIASLDTVKEDMLLSNINWVYPIKQLDPHYFDVRPGKYRELIMDSAKRQFLIHDLEIN